MVGTLAATLLMTRPALIPLPAILKPGKGRFDLPKHAKLYASAEAEPEARQVAELLGLNISKTLKSSQVSLQLRKSEEPSLGPEGYRLSITNTGIRLVAAQRPGLFYGIQTLKQLLQKRGDHHTFECQEIQDKPRYAWRGLMLDCSRHFWPKEFIFKLLDAMASYKLNTFHWHLVDDQGWRIEIKRYPKLTQIGSSRPQTIDPQGNIDPTPISGFYTQEDAREVVAYAAARHITVVPEIEMPGHSTAALAAYPKLSCTGGPFEVGQRFGVYDDIYCAGREEVFTFLQNVLDEVLDIFPSKFIHIGGDEAPKERWQKCPECQLRKAVEHLANEDELQSYFIESMDEYLVSHNRRLIGWDEILEGGLAKNAAVMSWRGRTGGIAAAQAGHDAVMTPGDYCYFDHYQAKEGEPRAIGGYLPLENVYVHNPTPEVLSPDQADHILGVQANVWTEYMTTQSHVEYMIFPRLLALAEVAWTPQDLRKYPDFKKRLLSSLGALRAKGINFRDKGLEPKPVASK